MKKVEGKLEFSITDIVRYFRSPYSSWATWANLEYPGTVFLEKDMVQNSSLLLRSEKNEDDAFIFDMEDEIMNICRTFSMDNKKQQQNLIETIKQNCRKIVREKTGKKPFTNINITGI